MKEAKFNFIPIELLSNNFSTADSVTIYPKIGLVSFLGDYGPLHEKSWFRFFIDTEKNSFGWTIQEKFINLDQTKGLFQLKKYGVGGASVRYQVVIKKILKHLKFNPNKKYKKLPIKVYKASSIELPVNYVEIE